MLFSIIADFLERSIQLHKKFGLFIYFNAAHTFFNIE